MKTWEHHEKFRAGLLKLAGIILCTPICAILLDQLVHGINMTWGLIGRSLFSVLIFYAGFKLIAISVGIMYNLDERIYYARLHNSIQS